MWAAEAEERVEYDPVAEPEVLAQLWPSDDPVVIYTFVPSSQNAKSSGAFWPRDGWDP